MYSDMISQNQDITFNWYHVDIYHILIVACDTIILDYGIIISCIWNGLTQPETMEFPRLFIRHLGKQASALQSIQLARSILTWAWPGSWCGWLLWNHHRWAKSHRLRSTAHVAPQAAALHISSVSPMCLTPYRRRVRIRIRPTLIGPIGLWWGRTSKRKISFSIRQTSAAAAVAAQGRKCALDRAV